MCPGDLHAINRLVYGVYTETAEYTAAMAVLAGDG